MTPTEIDQSIVKSFQKYAIAEIVLLFAQFQMGIVTNLFITPLMSLTAPWTVFLQSASTEFAIHILNGIAIFGVAIALLITFRHLRRSIPWKLVVIALIFTGVAVAAGFVFFLLGQNDTFSIIMAMCYISIYTLYFAAIYLIKKK
jgi:hypothetical protein